MKSKWLSAAVVAALSSLAALAPLAQADTPAPGYTQFAGCPSPKENPAVEACLRSVIKSGHVKIGSKDVPIANPITLSGGLLPGGAITANAKGGLSPVKQTVPGGVIGLTGLDWLVNFLNLEGLKLFAVTELAGQPVLGTTLSLPIKVHLINPVLGNNCYIGSNANPLKLDLTVETTNPPPPNKPITGKSPEFGFNPETGIVTQKGGTFVDNAFSAPGASGCVLTLFGFLPINLNPLVNAQSGLPAAAGTNETIQNFDNELASPLAVYR